MQYPERITRLGSLFVTESLDFACYLTFRGLTKTSDSPRPTKNKHGALKKRHEWCFEDPEQRGEELFEDFKSSEVKQILQIRIDFLRELNNRREDH